MFHYNGHGVPKPTKNGEIWVFNKTYTQYIPLSIYDLQAWMGSPSIYVYDCSNAGLIIQKFLEFAEQHQNDSADFGGNTGPNGMSESSTSGFIGIDRKPSMENRKVPSEQTLISDAVNSAQSQQQTNGDSLSPVNYKDCIQLAACQSDQILPLNPELPADLFTSCLTTPIRVSG